MLAAAGLRVRILYVRQYSKAIPSSDHSDAKLLDTSEWLLRQGIRLEILPTLGIAAGDSPELTAEMASSLSVLWWMQRAEHGTGLEPSVLCQDYLGACALPISARRAQVAL